MLDDIETFLVLSNLYYLARAGTGYLRQHAQSQLRSIWRRPLFARRQTHNDIVSLWDDLAQQDPMEYQRQLGLLPESFQACVVYTANDRYSGNSGHTLFVL